MTVRRCQFEGWTLDCTALQLQGPAGPVALRPKTFEVLQFLVEHPGRVVTREEILDAIWPGVTVTEELITQCVSEVRQALGDQQQRIIKTLPGAAISSRSLFRRSRMAPALRRIRPVPFPQARRRNWTSGCGTKLRSQCCRSPISAAIPARST